MLASLDYAKPIQDEDELDQLIHLFQEHRVTSYLEIGSRYGGSFERVMMALPKGSLGVAIDFPGGPFGDHKSAPILLAAIDRINKSGREAFYIFGPSAAPEVVKRATLLAPTNAKYDAVLIDGDHSYGAVKNDFFLYGQMARFIAVHDIAATDAAQSRTGLPVEVPRFWNEVKDRFPHQEFITRDSIMGIGVVLPR